MIVICHDVLIQVQVESNVEQITKRKWTLDCKKKKKKFNFSSRCFSEPMCWFRWYKNRCIVLLFWRLSCFPGVQIFHFVDVDVDVVNFRSTNENITNKIKHIFVSIGIIGYTININSLQIRVDNSQHFNAFVCNRYWICTCINLYTINTKLTDTISYQLSWTNIFHVDTIPNKKLKRNFNFWIFLIFLFSF
jgi:hypothetical protein